MTEHRMPAGRHHRKAFTLIELLVVIAILTLLVSFLIPVLTKARGIAIRAVCMTNYKSMGGLIYQFVNAHGGRGPSDCWGYDNSGQERGRSWTGYINVEVLGMRHYWETNAGYIQAMGYKPKKGLLYCPSEKWYGSLYPRAQELNINVAGGNSVGEMYSTYGITLPNDRCPSLPMPDDMIATNKWEVYGLGPLIEKFPRPNWEFLVVETEAGWEYTGGSWPYTDIQIGAWGSSQWVSIIPPWGDTGTSHSSFAFRHTLPPDLSSYQTTASANFLYIDGHVDYMNPNKTINRKDRFYFMDAELN